MRKTLAAVGTTEPELDGSASQLDNLVSESVSGYHTAFLRGVPSHEDFAGHNVLIKDENLITGVID